MNPDNTHIRIAVDAMGGDFAPQNVILGARDALRETGNRFKIILIGPEEHLRREIDRLGDHSLNWNVVNATQVIDMDDAATAAIKHKKNSSIAVGISLHKESRADAFVSAGHTGAVMSASLLILGRIAGVSRPTIGTFFPSINGVCLLLDAGTNIDCKPQHLYEFAVMGSVYAARILRKEQPTIGLLSIGEESSKGNEVTLAAHALLRRSSLNFVGNVEGRDILKGKTDVVVCDGFVGNIVLKFGESVLDFLKAKLRQHASKGVMKKLWVTLMSGTLKTILRDFDYQEYGGVPLLGVNGVTIIGHGKSTPKAIKNMILKAEEMVQNNINRYIHEALVQAK